MSGRSRWLLLAAVVVAVVVVLLLWRGRRLEPRHDRGPEGAFDTSDVPVESPELSIDIGTVKWTHHPTYTDWACLIQCREPDGCHAELQLVVEYVSSGERKRLTLGGRIDASNGETVRIGRAQRPATAIERVERVTVEVLSAFRPGDPIPTPMQ